MRYVEVDGLRLSRIGLGTWQFGSWEWGYGEGYARETAPALIRRALGLGISLLDTAELYGFGRSERIIGRTLASLDDGEVRELVVASKFLPIAPAEPIVARQAAGSRRRLGVDAIDLYYVHWPNPFVSVRRTMQAVRPLLEAGVVRHVGVSNYRLGDWLEAERALRAPVVADQVRFSLLSPGPAIELVPYAAATGRVVVAYSPLAQGLLAGDRRASGGRAGAMRARDRRFSPAGRRRLEPLTTALAEVAAVHEATAAQVALAWILSHPATVAIPGARTLEQLDENAAAADLDLSAAEVERLSAEVERLSAEALALRAGR